MPINDVKNKDIKIHTIYMGNDSDGQKLLKDMSLYTNGMHIIVDLNSSLSVEKISNVTSGFNGTLVNFTITVTNTGNAILDPVIVTDTLPEGLDYVSST